VVDIWQPEPLNLGGLFATRKVCDRRQPYLRENALPLFKRGWDRRTATGDEEQFEAARDLVSRARQV
jgi:hypothetical protein